MKIQKIKKTGELIINYNKVFTDSNNYTLLKKMIEGWRDITFVVDTNQHIDRKPIDINFDYLSQAGINHKIVEIRANESLLFGVKVRISQNKKRGEKLIIMDILYEQFNEELFDLIKNYDIAIGLGREKPFEETCNALIRNISEVLFNKCFFEESIYNSVVCSSLRISSNIKNIEAVINEMGL